MSEQELRNHGVQILWEIIAATCFGFWQESFLAGVFVFFVLDLGLNVFVRRGSR